MPVTDNIPGLWDKFLTEFWDQFQDTQAAQRARNELRDCKMKGADYDNYVISVTSIYSDVLDSQACCYEEL